MVVSEGGKLPLTEDGCFLAYKGVSEDYKDVHSGSIDNSPGAIVSMSRNKISDDPNEGCHVGLHVGAIEYAGSFGPRVVICKVSPEHVVCVPRDNSFQKMRVCEYEVIGNHGGTLSNTVERVDPFNYNVESDDSFTDDDCCDDDCEEFEGDEDLDEECDSGDLDKADLDAMTARELMDLTLDVLRQYAGKGLKIVGASKIPGGKAALVGKIIRVRKKK